MNRRKWFSNPVFAQIVVDQWKYYEGFYHFNLITYAVLPDHYHVLVNVGSEKTISQILHAVNSYTATEINQAMGMQTKIKIWEGNAWDVVIYNDFMYWQKVAYTLLNAWRAGLVKDPFDVYPFSDIGEWLNREGEGFLADLFSRYKRQME
jgi:REP element-mobilizing transposase RayT